MEVGAAYTEVGRAVESLTSTMQAWLRGWPCWRLATIDHRCPRPATPRPIETRHPVDMNEIRHPSSDRRPPNAGNRHNTRKPRRQQTLQPPGEPSRCLTLPCRRPRSIVSDITFSNCTEQLIWYTFFSSPQLVSYILLFHCYVIVFLLLHNISNSHICYAIHGLIVSVSVSWLRVEVIAQAPTCYMQDHSLGVMFNSP